MILISIDSLNVKKVDRPMPSKFAEPCLLCGRAVFPEAPPMRPKGIQFVEITTDGYIVWAPEGAAVPSVPNSQGAFPVGWDCYQKIKAAAAAQEAK
jgi:hypothetical protein